jgi:SRSO17 transposase
MNGQRIGSESNFADYVEGLVDVIGHADRAEPLKDYCLGLMLPVERKSVEPLAAVTAPGRVSSKHQSLLHFVGQAPWSDAALLGRVGDLVLPLIEQHGPVEAWIIDDTGFPKKGKHSVGVARQYCGQLGKQDNCQVAVSLSIANVAASLPIAYRLYLPEIWADDPVRRREAKIPDEVAFQTKPAIALDQIGAAQAAGVAPGVVLADAGYGADGAFRTGLSALGLDYVVGVQPTLSVWRPGEGPLPPKPWRGKGRPTSLMRRSPEHSPVSAKALAQELPQDAWQTIGWREGTNTELGSRFAAVRVRPASRDYNLTTPRAEEWLLIEWPEGDAEPLKYWLSTLAADASLAKLVSTAKLRWRIERDYQELKQELGLGHYEGRGWRGFHHHASLCIAAYGFLISHREAIPPSAPTETKNRPEPAVPQGYRPRGSPDPTRATHTKFDCHDPKTLEHHTQSQPPAMSMLHQDNAR